VSGPVENSSLTKPEGLFEGVLGSGVGEKPRKGSGTGEELEFFETNKFETVGGAKEPVPSVFINVKPEGPNQRTSDLDNRNLDVLDKPDSSQLQTDIGGQKREYRILKVFCRSPDDPHNNSGTSAMENPELVLAQDFNTNRLPIASSGLAEENLGRGEPHNQIFDNDNNPVANHNAPNDNCSTLSSDTNFFWYKIFGTDVTLEKLKKITQ
jgi:hypothetical protein